MPYLYQIHNTAGIQALFEKQYTFTLREEIHTHYCMETTTEEISYDYYILHVTLANKNIETLTPEQKEMFDTYMETKGNKPNIFGHNIYTPTPGCREYTNYKISPEVRSDERFAAMFPGFRAVPRSVQTSQAGGRDNCQGVGLRTASASHAHK